MFAKLTLMRRVGFVAISGAFIACATSMAVASGIANESLRRDAQRLAGDAMSARIFSHGEIAALQQIASQPSPDADIDQFLKRKAVIEVTINPEARVSIQRTQVPLTMPQCGKPGAWLIRIVNQGFVSARLNFRILAASSTKLLILNPVTPHLTGAAIEYRALHYGVKETHQMDITLGVDAGPATSDIGERARLSLLLQCK